MKRITIPAAVLAMLCGSAIAQQATDSKPPMWSHEILDDNDHTIIDHCDVPAQPAVPATATEPERPAVPAGECHNLTVGMLIARLLFKPDDKLDGETRWARGSLGDRIKHDPSTVLDLGEKAAIQKLVGEGYPPFIVNQINRILFPEERAPKLRVK